MVGILNPPYIFNSILSQTKVLYNGYEGSYDKARCLIITLGKKYVELWLISPKICKVGISSGKE
jgi:hypothetical protein